MSNLAKKAHIHRNTHFWIKRFYQNTKILRYHWSHSLTIFHLCPQSQPQPQPQQCQHPQRQTLPLLTPPQYRVGWFAKTEIFVFGNQLICPVRQNRSNFQTKGKTKKSIWIQNVLKLCYIICLSFAFYVTFQPLDIPKRGGGTHKHTNTQTDRHTDIVTYRLKRPRSQLSIKEKKKKFSLGGGGVVFGIGANIPSM